MHDTVTGQRSRLESTVDPRGAAAEALEMIIPTDVQIQGDIRRDGESPIVVYGCVAGAIRARGGVIIEQGGRLVGDVECAELIVAGEIRGPEGGRGQLQCQSLYVKGSGRLSGRDLSVRYESIRVDVGAQVEASLIPAAPAVASQRPSEVQSAAAPAFRPTLVSRDERLDSAPTMPHAPEPRMPFASPDMVGREGQVEPVSRRGGDTPIIPVALRSLSAGLSMPAEDAVDEEPAASSTAGEVLTPGWHAVG